MSYKCTLSPELLAKAAKELTEDPNTRRQEIKALRERLERNPAMKIRTDDSFLLRFLRARKFDQERAYALIMTFYQMKFDNADLYATMTPSAVKHCLDVGVSYYLDTRDKQGCKILVFTPGRWDPEKYPIMDLFKTNFVVLSKIIQDEDVQVSGIRLIVNLEGLGWPHAKCFTPSYAKHASSLFQDAFPVRVKGMHLINEPSMFDYVFAIMRPFFKEKIRSRMFFHGAKLEELLQYIDADSLPEDIGGKLPTFNTKKFVKELMQCESDYKKETKYGLINMKLKGEKKSADAVETMSGTFKKLNVD